MENIIDLYRKNHSLYNDFTNKMLDLITTILLKKGIRVHSIASRVKEESSLENKINKKGYADIEDITDLCGIRIITYFEDDVDQVAGILQEMLSIDPRNSVDKRKLLAATQFGYLSLHLVAGLTTEQLQQPRSEKFVNCKIEIQVRSILQHAWAEIEHDLGYKAQPAISSSTRRSFSRLAGLLELADAEFIRLRDELQPSHLPAASSALTYITKLFPKNISERLPEKPTRKFAFVQALCASIVKRSETIPLKKMSGYALMSVILSVIATHLSSASHLLSPVAAALKTEKTWLFSFVSSYMSV